MTKKKKIMGKDFKKYVTLIPDDVEIWVGISEYHPDDVEIWVGISEYHSPLVDILKDIKNNRAILVNQTYLDDCIELEKKE